MTVRRFLENLRSSDQRWKGYVLIGVVVYFVLINQVIRVRPDHIFLALLFISLLFGRERSKKFVVDWSPFVLFWVAYDMMRGIVDNLRGYVHTIAPYRWEHALFSWAFGGQIPSFYFQDWQLAWDGTVLKGLFDASGGLFYTLHFGLPLLLGWVFWHTLDERDNFYRFAWTLTVLNFSALATFLAFPTAPPWYVFHEGFAQPPPTSYWGLGAGSLINVDRMLKMKFFQTLWGGFNPNHFAAIPSLHGAYPVVVSFFTYKRFRRYPVALALYPLGVWFSAVYLNQHYIVDLLIGTAYAAAAYLLVERVLMPKVFLRTVLRGERHVRRNSQQVAPTEAATGTTNSQMGESIA